MARKPFTGERATEAALTALQGLEIAEIALRSSLTAAALGQDPELRERFRSAMARLMAHGERVMDEAP